MLIKTGLEVRVEHQYIPLGTREVVVFQHPDSDFPARMPLPETTVGSIWILQFFDRDSKRHQHMSIVSKEPKVRTHGLELEIVADIPEMYRHIENELRREGAPTDAHRKVESRYGLDVFKHTYTWDEVLV